MRHLDGLVNNISELGGTNTFTKVVTQFVQFLSDNRATTALDEQVGIAEEENMELTA